MQQLIQPQQYNVAIYCRLSRDDGADSVSMSIENQRETLIEYVTQKNWNVYDVYVDDGYSGTNFNRPGFTKLINDIEKKKINCVITKDLSRLGRNYLQTGYYTEDYFPRHDVRYIAVNDSFDSLKENDFAPFKNIMNEWYAKDISKKVRFSLNQKMKQAKVLGCSVPLYGYINQNDGTRILDPETAPIVKRIFTEYINGSTPTEIINGLINDKIVCPGYYIYIKYNNRGSKYINADEKSKYKWHTAVINRMLSNIEYTGALINHKYENMSFKIKKRIKVADENRYMFYDVFEPIITKEEFELAKKKAKSYIKNPISKDENLFHGLLCCSRCGSILKYQRKFEEGRETRCLYMCRNKNCKTPRTCIKASNITEIVKNDIAIVKDLLLSNEDSFLEFAKTYVKQTDNKNDDSVELYEKLLSESKKIDDKIAQLFEAKLNDEIPISTYEKLAKKYKDEKESIDSKLSTMKVNKPKEEIDYVLIAHNILDLFKYNDVDELMKHELLIRLINMIIINKENNKYKITINYCDSNLIKEFILCNKQ